jgi:hypothetical protein
MFNQPSAAVVRVLHTLARGHIGFVSETDWPLLATVAAKAARSGLVPPYVAVTIQTLASASQVNRIEIAKCLMTIVEMETSDNV